MIPFVLTGLFAFIIYLVLTAGSGDVGLWSAPELLTGLLLAALVGAVAREFFCRHRNYRMLNPIRLLLLLVYACVPFFIEMTMANLNVAYRVITGKIRPGIMRVSSGMKTDLGVTLLADSITLTPGTLSVDLDEETNDLFIHIINMEEGEELQERIQARGLFSVSDIPAWIRRIAE